MREGRREIAGSPLPPNQETHALPASAQPLGDLGHGHQVIWLDADDPQLRDRFDVVERRDDRLGERICLTVEVGVADPEELVEYGLVLDRAIDHQGELVLTHRPRPPLDGGTGPQPAGCPSGGSRDSSASTRPRRGTPRHTRPLPTDVLSSWG